MRVLVTGAGGFVGRYLIENLLAAGHDVTALSHRPFEAPSGVAVEVFDIRSREDVQRAFERHNPGGVIHLAAQASVKRSWEDPNQTYEVNLIGAANVLEALKERPEARVLLVGSAQQYGSPKKVLPIVETDPLEPVSPYGLSKVAQEMLGRIYFGEFGLKTIMARSFNHTGPGQSDEYVIGAFCRSIVEAERTASMSEITVGNLDSVRDFTDVRDVAEAYRLLLEQGAPGEAYNVSSGEGRRIGDLLKVLLDAARRPIDVLESGTRRLGDPPMLVGDNSKIRETTGWRPAIPLERSLEEALDWCRNRVEDRDG